MRKLAALLLLAFFFMNCGFLAVNYRRDLPAEVLEAEYADTASQFLEIDGARLHLKDEGPRDGEPLLLLHGTGASLHTWNGWVEALGSSFRIIRFDLPGFGLTGPNQDRDYRITRYVQTTKALLDHLGISSADVAGNSLGGHVAWRLALDHPTRVRRLVLIDSAGYASIDGRPVNVLDAGKVPFTRSILRRVTPKSMIAQGLRDVYVDDSKVTPPLIERHYRMLLRQGNRDAMIDRLNATWEDREADLPNVSQPTLIQWGAQDTWIPVAVAARFEQSLPNARLIIYDNGGHVPMEELPEVTSRDARAFLLEAPPPVSTEGD